MNYLRSFLMIFASMLFSSCPECDQYPTTGVSFSEEEKALLYQEEHTNEDNKSARDPLEETVLFKNNLGDSLLVYIEICTNVERERRLCKCKKSIEKLDYTYRASTSNYYLYQGNLLDLHAKKSKGGLSINNGEAPTEKDLNTGTITVRPDALQLYYPHRTPS